MIFRNPRLLEIFSSNFFYQISEVKNYVKTKNNTYELDRHKEKLTSTLAGGLCLFVLFIRVTSTEQLTVKTIFFV